MCVDDDSDDNIDKVPIATNPTKVSKVSVDPEAFFGQKKSNKGFDFMDNEDYYLLEYITALIKQKPSLAKDILIRVSSLV